MLGDQCLVGRHYMLAIGNGLQHQLARRLITPDEFHHDLHIRLRNHLKGIGAQYHAAGIYIVEAGLARGSMGNANAAARPAGNLFLVARQHIGRTAANGPQTQ